MKFRLVSNLDSAAAEAVEALAGSSPNAHYTQLPAWAGVESEQGGRPCYYLGEDEGRVRVAGVVRLRSAPLVGLTLADLFRGPMADSAESLLEGLAELRGALEPMRAVALRIDPYWSGPGTETVRRGLVEMGFAPMTSAPWHERSLEISINLEPEALISSFKPAARRQVRKALKMGLDIRDDLDDETLKSFHAIYMEMSETKGASHQTAAFFRGIRDLFRAWPRRGFFLSSWIDGELLGAISVFTLGRRAIYAYGASSLRRPEIPKSHLLHFTAMQRARACGCSVYDMGGFAQGVGDDATRTPTQKINYFKSGFGGREIDFVPAHELVLRPTAWRALRAADGVRRRLTWQR